MGNALDFLFEGKPPPSTTTYGSTTTDMPKWLSDYTQGLIGRANSIAAEPYQAYGGPRLAGLNEDQMRSFDITRGSSGSYMPGMTAAQGAAQGAPGTAQPYFDKAAQTYPDQASRYMNPYISNVIDRAGTLAQRQLNEKFLPGVQQMFGAAGASPRSTNMRRTVDQGVRDLTEGLHEQALGALSQGYQQGASAFGADASRMGAIGQMAGNLQLGSAALGGGLATDMQTAQLRDAQAQNAIGAQQQQDTQRSLDLAHQDFEQQRDYPMQQADWLSNIIRGTPHGTTGTSTSTGPGSIFQPSPLAQLGSLATGVGGIMEVFGDQNARGGRIRRRPRPRYNEGGLRYAYGS
jgi:hypothetical protein